MDEEESATWMADPFPTVRFRYSKMQASTKVDREEAEEEGRIVTAGASRLTQVLKDGEVMLSEWR